MKKELINRIIERLYDKSDHADLTKILEEELPDFQRIDEERFKRIYASKVCDIGLHIKEYNSTLPPALKPLPKDMPKEYNSLATPYQVWLQVQQEYGTPANNLQPLPKEMPKWFHNGISYHDLWSMVCLNYGTPEPKPDLPTVEELEKEINVIYNSSDPFSHFNSFKTVAQHLIGKYSLHTREEMDKLKQELEDERIRHAACGTAALGYFTGCHEKYLSASLQDVINLRLKYEGLMNNPREWWQDCEKFMYKGRALKKYSHEVFPDGRTFLHSELSRHDLQDCAPYIHPSAQDIIAKHNLSEEEVRAIREGKCT